MQIQKRYEMDEFNLSSQRLSQGTWVNKIDKHALPILEIYS